MHQFEKARKAQKAKTSTKRKPIISKLNHYGLQCVIRVIYKPQTSKGSVAFPVISDFRINEKIDVLINEETDESAEFVVYVESEESTATSNESLSRQFHFKSTAKTTDRYTTNILRITPA